MVIRELQKSKIPKKNADMAHEKGLVQDDLFELGFQQIRCFLWYSRKKYLKSWVCIFYESLTEKDSNWALK